MRSPDGNDVRRAAATFGALVADRSGPELAARAGELTWTAAEVVAHVADVCGFYAIHLGARSPRRLPVDVALHAGASAADRAAAVDAVAEHLAGVVEASPPDARGWHFHGLADPAGFAAMACDELLVHGGDVAQGWGRPFAPDRDLCARVLARLFPWAPADTDPWDALRWANGRIALSGHPRLAPDWVWRSAPLHERGG